MENIEAKPTKYRGIQFRSRLEARWGVLLDNYFMVGEWFYEPKPFTDSDSGWTYTPDFRISASVFHYWLEVKPVLPDVATLEALSLFATKLNGLPLILAFGSFYEEVPRIVEIPAHSIPAGKIKVAAIRKAAVSLESSPLFARSGEAAKVAATYRFDLPNDPAPAIRRNPNASASDFLRRVNWKGRPLPRTKPTRRRKRRK